MADRHTDHDLLLVAAFAAGDAEAADLVRAEALVAACTECATLATDLQAIARATAEVPAPRRPRDFFVRPADAERLRPHGLRRLAAALGGSRVQLARPLAGGLMMLGFAGLVVASLPGASPRELGTASDQRLEAQASPTPASDIQGGRPQAAVPSGQPAASGGDLLGSYNGAGQGASTPPGAGGPGSSAQPGALKASREPAAGPSVLVLGSVALLAIGAALFLASLRRTGTRRS